MRSRSLRAAGSLLASQEVVEHRLVGIGRCLCRGLVAVGFAAAGLFWSAGLSATGSDWTSRRFSTFCWRLYPRSTLAGSSPARIFSSAVRGLRAREALAPSSRP